ncbi:MAG: ATP-binding protein [Actinomycetota bacterium]|nr:ATP-binding protein [Actinomycetota bacterium]
MRRLGIRRRLLVLVVVSLAAVLAGVVLVFNVLLDRSLSHNADERARARAAVALAEIRTVNERLTVRNGPEAVGSDASVWIFSPGLVVEAPRADTVLAKAAGTMNGTGPRFQDVAGKRLYAAPIISRGKRLGTVVSAVSLEPYEDSSRAALIASLALAGIVLVAVALGASWVLAASLSPVARMTAQAEQWSDRSLGKRFALGEPYDELTQLAATLDGLLDRLEASLRHEQRFSAELSHELRTPLARLIASADLALRRERTPEEYRAALADVRRAGGSLTRTVDALVAAARLEAGGARGTSDAFAVADEAAEACAGLAAKRGVELTVEPPAQPIRLGIELELAERILQPLVENGCRHGRTFVHVSMARTGGGVVYSIVDDGAGVDTSDRERIFEPGVRGRNAIGAGAGLGLALAQRLARSAAGEVELLDGHFVVRLPAA